MPQLVMCVYIFFCLSLSFFRIFLEFSSVINPLHWYCLNWNYFMRSRLLCHNFNLFLNRFSFSSVHYILIRILLQTYLQIVSFFPSTDLCFLIVGFSTRVIVFLCSWIFFLAYFLLSCILLPSPFYSELILCFNHLVNFLVVL